MKGRRPGACWMVLPAVLACVPVACGKSQTPAPSGLMMIISTDLTPSEFDSIRVEVSQEQAAGSSQWHTWLDETKLVPGEARLPTTVFVQSGTSADQDGLLRVSAFLSSEPVVLREAQIQIPTDRVAEVRLVLSENCKGQVRIAGAEGEPVSTCPKAGESCQPETGTCGSSAINAAMLPTYVPGEDLDAAPGGPGARPGDGSPGADASRSDAHAGADGLSGEDATVEPDAADDGTIGSDANDGGPVGDGSLDCSANGTGAVGTLGCACSSPGAFACNGNAQTLVLQCVGSVWAQSQRCTSGQLCDSRPGATQGTCAPVDTACSSASPGQSVCGDPSNVVRCGPDLVSHTQVLSCPAQACVSGACTGACSPETTQCSGNGVETCNSGGTWGAAQACTNQTCVSGTGTGTCTGLCAPNQTHCTSLTKEQTCNFSGAWGPDTACANKTCVGTGIGSTCQGVCAQGQTQCSGSDVETCTPTGTWGTASACPASQTCQGVGCACPASTPNYCNSNCTSYQTDKFNCGSCAHGCQGGTCTAGVCQAFAVFSPGSAPVNIAVGGSAVYWTDSGSGGFVYSAPLNGGSSNVAATFGGDCGVLGLAVDSTSVYGIARTGTCNGITSGTLKTASLSGGSASTISSSLGAGFPPQPWRCLTVDATNVYYTNYDIQDVYRVATSGGAAVMLASTQSAPQGIAVQGANVYWGAAPGAGVMQEPVTGGTITPLASAGGGGFIAADASFVYYTNAGALMKTSTAGSTPVTLVASGAAGPLAIDASNVYYLGSSTVMEVSKAGGTVTTLATGQTSPVDIAVDATSVYWLVPTAVMKIAW